MAKVWKFEKKDESFAAAMVNIFANHCTYHDLTSTQAYEFSKIMDWVATFPKQLKECPEAPEEQSHQQKVDAAKKLLEEEGYAVAPPKKPVQLGPGAHDAG